MTEMAGETTRRFVLITRFFPEELAARGPWSERFDGLYGSMFHSAGLSKALVCWYAVDERTLRTRDDTRVSSSNICLFRFLLKEVLRAGLSKRKTPTSILVHYPFFKSREMMSNALLILCLKLLRCMPDLKVVLDFLDPPLLMPEIADRRSLAGRLYFAFLQKMENLYLACAHEIVTGGDDMSRLLSETYGIDIDHFFCIGQGTYVSGYQPGEARGRRNRLNVVYGGTFSESRGIVELFDCIDRISRTHDIRLICCGRPQGALSIPDRDWLSIRSGLTFKEYVEILTNEADVGVLPYPVNDWWGKISVSKVATYMAAGLPVVSTALPHTAAFIRQWDCGYSGVSWSAIEKFLTRLCEDGALCRKLGDNARTAAEKALDWQVLSRVLEERFTAERYSRPSTQSIRNPATR